MPFFRKRRPESAGPVIDPTRTWHPLVERLAVTTDTRQRQILESVIGYMRLVVDGDAGIDAALADDPAFHIWDDGDDIGPKGADDIRNYHRQLFASHANLLEFAIDRVILDDGGLVAEGFLRQIYPGRSAYQMGLIADDPGTDYLIEFRQLLIYAVDTDGKLSSLDSYNSGPSRVEKLTREQLPESYVEMMNESR